MICKHCETENPENSVFCMHCGKRLDSNNHCPQCNALCPEEAIFCNACGARIVQEAHSANENEAQKQPRYTEETLATAPKKSSGAFKKVKSAFDLSGGICLMTAVLFALVFTLCMGLTATVSGSSSVSMSETTMIWDYFGEAYDELATYLSSLESYTGYFEAANYIPVVFSTVICAGTLVCVLVFTIISAVKYGKHFKNPELNYATPAVAAILSFVLGATAFLAINSTSVSLYSELEVSVSFSGATTAGIVLGGVFLGLYFAFKVVTLGKEFVRKPFIVNFVCTLVGVLFLSLATAFAASPAVALKVTQSKQTLEMGLNFSNSNELISLLFSSESGAIPANFLETYICSVLAQVAQIAFLILALVTLISRIGKFGYKEKSCLGTSIALFSLAVVYLILSCVALHFGQELIAKYSYLEVSVAAAPIVALIASAFALADSVTHKVLIKKNLRN